MKIYKDQVEIERVYRRKHLPREIENVGDGTFAPPSCVKIDNEIKTVNGPTISKIENLPREIKIIERIPNRNTQRKRIANRKSELRGMKLKITRTENS